MENTEKQVLQSLPAKKKLRILLSSNAPWSTSGYAQQVRDLIPLIKQAGYDVAVVAFYGLSGGKIALDDVLYYPNWMDVWGSDAVIAHQRDFQADCVITFQDVWTINPEMLKQFKHWIPMLPIDQDPIPFAIEERARLAYRIVSHSDFGKKQLENKGMSSTYIPLLVDTEIFKPYPKDVMKQAIGLSPDTFLFGMVAANKDNPPRKSFQEAMDAFKMFHDKHPKSVMYFHTFTQQPGGFPIDDYAKFIGIKDSIRALDLYELAFKTDKTMMPKIYSAFDCLVAPSTNEGFGVPIIEAQACATPVITNNFTSMPELIKPGETGFLCDVAYKRFTPILSYVGIPSLLINTRV